MRESEVRNPKSEEVRMTKELGKPNEGGSLCLMPKFHARLQKRVMTKGELI